MAGFAVGIVVLVVTLGFAEGTLALLAPRINFVGQTAGLFRRQAFGQAAGHVPNARGISWGASVLTDENGFRVPADPTTPERGAVATLAVVGDSVAFGIGVEAEDTFAGRLARVLPVLNTAVTGYSARDYRDLTVHLLVPRRAELRLSEVLLFLTLNDASSHSARDIRSYLEAREPAAGMAWRAARLVNYNKWLIRHSRLYLAIKATLYDSSRVHFQMDLATLRDPARVQELASLVGETREALLEVGVGVTVFLTPDEYQLRVPKPELLFPQRALARALEQRGVELIDLYPEFAREIAEGRVSSRDLFLFNDHCHLSRSGHVVVARVVGTHLGLSESEVDVMTN